MDQQNETGFLHEIEQEMYVDPVTPGVRFVNYILDLIVIVLIIFVIVFAWLYIILSKGEKLDDSILLQDTLQTRIINTIAIRIIVIIYYTLCEAATKGRTFGKMVTNTIAITEDGTPFTFKHALLRSLCRAIPFEPFSAFGYRPWHDSLSKTAVVKKTWN